MGCVASKLVDEEEVVSICRERKKLLRLAVERRAALAESHFRYCESLYAVSAAVRLFVARHSSPASPFLIEFSPAQPPTAPASTAGDVASGCGCGLGVTTSAMLLRQRLSEPTKETVVPPPASYESCGKGSPSSDGVSDCCCLSEGEEVEETEGEEGGGGGGKDGFCEEGRNGYYYMEMQAQAESPGRDFGWDFFNPFFGMRPEAMNGYQDNDLHLRVVREEEGIPELEDEVVSGYAAARASNMENEMDDTAAVMEKDFLEEVMGKEGGCDVIDSSESDDVDGRRKGITFMNDEKGRELLEALGDIEDHFRRAYDSGKEVSRMLEASKVHLQSDIQGIKENLTKLLQSIAQNRSTSSRATSCKSLVAYGSSSSNWTEYNNDLFEDYDGMVSGSHSLTLERLYAWEKKLYEEVKTGDGIRKLYKLKCSRIRDQDVRGDDSHAMDKNRAAMKDLYARILVAIRSTESISMKIEKLRDEELQPQIVELLRGLMQTWRIMLESHETQNKITSEVGNFACPSYGKFCNNFHRLATLQLEAEVQNWRECFIAYVAAQKSYAEAVNGWLLKFLAPEIKFCSKGRNSAAPFQINGPLLLPICHNWLISLNKLPDKAVARAMKGFAKDIRVLWTQQGEEQQQKRKVDGLARELEKRTPRSFPKTEAKFLEYKVSQEKLEPDRDENGYSSDKSDHVDSLRRKLDMEKERHHKYMEETHRVTLNGFRTGFGAVFESLTEFSKAAKKMYSELVAPVESSEKAENVPYRYDAHATEETEFR